MISLGHLKDCQLCENTLSYLGGTALPKFSTFLLQALRSSFGGIVVAEKKGEGMSMLVPARYPEVILKRPSYYSLIAREKEACERTRRNHACGANGTRNQTDGRNQRKAWK